MSDNGGRQVDRDLVAQGIDEGNIPSLLMVLVQLTGDRRWLAEPYAPHRARGLDDNDDGGLTEAIQARALMPCLRPPASCWT